MDSICRLCCSTKFVNNNLFDEENALYLKMELFLPIKIMKGDKLPQKVCNRCSCKVNDIYQFCNFAIEAQDRIRRMVLQIDNSLHQSIDLSLTKQESLITTTLSKIKTEQGTQTETDTPLIDTALVDIVNEPLKREPSISPTHIKTESSVDFDDCNDFHSDSSDNLSLVVLRQRKNNHKSNTNGESQPKKTRKKKPKQPTDKDKVDDKLNKSVRLDIVAQELDPSDDLGVTVDLKKIKKELDEEKEQIRCCICFNLFYSRSAMLQHYRQHVSEVESMEPPAPPPVPDSQAPKCPRCRKVVEAGAWAGHWARHWEKDRRPYRCALCEKTFRNPQQILNHGKTHKAGEAEPVKKRFVCDLCPEGFVYMRYLVSHRARAHPEAAGRALSLRCAVCARPFAHLNSLRRHLRAHSGERNFLCSVCGKALSSREHLKFHLRIHTGYKPNVCKTCGKGFVKKCNLTLHERVHSGEKPHVCSHCGKAFSQRSTLVIHERYHSGARPYACALCGRGFVAKGLLSMHLKTTCI